MALFKFLKTAKPMGFVYQPRFYNERKEAFQERLRSAEELAGDDPEALKSRIRRSLGRKSSYLDDRKYRQSRVLRSNLLLVFIIAVLVVVTYAVLKLYLPMLLDFMGK